MLRPKDGTFGIKVTQKKGLEVVGLRGVAYIYIYIYMCVCVCK